MKRVMLDRKIEILISISLRLSLRINWLHYLQKLSKKLHFVTHKTLANAVRQRFPNHHEPYLQNNHNKNLNLALEHHNKIYNAWQIPYQIVIDIYPVNICKNYFEKQWFNFHTTAFKTKHLFSHCARKISTDWFTWIMWLKWVTVSAPPQETLNINTTQRQLQTKLNYWFGNVWRTIFKAKIHL